MPAGGLAGPPGLSPMSGASGRIASTTGISGTLSPCKLSSSETGFPYVGVIGHQESESRHSRPNQSKSQCQPRFKGAGKETPLFIGRMTVSHCQESCT